MSQFSRVVITGAGIVSPLGVGRSAFHRSLLEGRSGIREISIFDATLFTTRIAAEVREGEELLDPVSARSGSTAPFDRKVGFALDSARQALFEAFGDLDEIPYSPRRRGLSFGVGVEIFRMEDIVPCCDVSGSMDVEALEASPRGQSVRHRFRIPSDLGPRMIRELARIRGRSRVNVGACVASAQAVGEGFRMIQRGRAEMVLVGGADSMINPLAVAGFGLLSATSASNHLGSGASRPFDRRRDGFVLGEGGAALILECLESAQNRGATILAEVVGYGTSLDAFKITDPAEDGDGATRSMQGALRDARIEPCDVSYINAHGTSTIKNDVVETMAIRKVFGDHAKKIPISSTKSMMGHCIAAAGAMEAVACLLPFERGQVHPTINLIESDPDCDLDYIPGVSRDVDARFVLSNSFGFGGQNATLILGRYPMESP